jgi:hypothetical protein
MNPETSAITEETTANLSNRAFPVFDFRDGKPMHHLWFLHSFGELAREGYLPREGRNLGFGDYDVTSRSGSLPVDDTMAAEWLDYLENFPPFGKERIIAAVIQNYGVSIARLTRR